MKEPPLIDLIDEALDALHLRLGEYGPAPVGLVTGSGLGALVKLGRELASIGYGEIPGLGSSTVEGHAGRWSLIEVEGTRVFCLCGRRHLYEGVEPRRVGLSMHLLARLGVERVILTNAAGGLAPRLDVGDLMLIADHLNLAFRNPLAGAHDATLGPRFVDMSEPYDRAMAEMLRRCARETGVELKEGVYAGMLGPSYETWAEAGLLRRLGADAVGMSTVPETLAARQAGLNVAAISLIANSYAHPAARVEHQEVLDAAARSAERLSRLLAAAIPRLASGQFSAP